MPQRLDITRRLHERLLENVRTALPLITTSPADADLTGLAHLRGEMVQAMESYCSHAHQVRSDALDHGDARGLHLAQVLVDGCASLISSYEAFRDRWAQRHAMENWYEYRLSAIVMMKQVRNHVQQADAGRMAQLTLVA